MPLSRDRAAARRGYLLRDLEPPGRDQGDRRLVRRGNRAWCAQFVQFAAAGRGRRAAGPARDRSEEHTSELKSIMRISYAVFCVKKKIITKDRHKRIDITHI